MTRPIIKIEQTRSPIRRHHSQRATLIGLGLNCIGRVSELPDTPETRGMIEKVGHLVRVIEPAHGEARPISKVRFEALAAYIRDPHIVGIFEELEWYATDAAFGDEEAARKLPALLHLVNGRVRQRNKLMELRTPNGSRD